MLSMLRALLFLPAVLQAGPIGELGAGQQPDSTAHAALTEPISGSSGDSPEGEPEGLNKARLPGDASEEIRIQIDVGRGAFAVFGAGLTFAATAGPLAPTALRGRVDLRCVGGAVAVGRALLSPPAALLANGPLRLLGKTLRGRLEVVCDGNRWSAINVLPIETYLEAVLGGEMPVSFPAAALQAQAVAARSYALMRKIEATGQGRGYHLGASVLSQVYRGLAHEDPRSRAAVTATRGEVLAVGVSPVEAYFHASCGGRTEAGAAALGRRLPYLTPVDCPCQKESPTAHWEASLSAAEVGKAVGFEVARAAAVVSRTGTGRALRVRVESRGGGVRTVAAADLRAALGYQRLPSLWFELRTEGQRFLFAGRGAGHGAGLCQWGAKVLAEQGYGYREILAHYYPGTSVERIY